MVFAYAGTLSLAAELKPAALQDLEAGQVFIAGGSPGHCVIVMDVAVNGAGRSGFCWPRAICRPRRSIC